MGVTVCSTFMGGCAFLQHNYEWVWLFSVLLWVGVTGSGWVWMVACVSGWVWLGKGGCGCVWLGVCDCLKHIYGWVHFSGRHLWVDVSVQSAFMDECTFSEHIYECVWLFRAFLWMSVGGCGWVWLRVGEYDWVWVGVTGYGEIWLGVDGWLKW